jgi:hypothetical protein
VNEITGIIPVSCYRGMPSGKIDLNFALYDPKDMVMGLSSDPQYPYSTSPEIRYLRRNPD